MAETYCTQCGTPNAAGWAFCVKCGARLNPREDVPQAAPEPGKPPEQNTPPNPYAKPPKAPPKWKKLTKRQVIWIAAGAAALFVALLVTVGILVGLALSGGNGGLRDPGYFALGSGGERVPSVSYALREDRKLTDAAYQEGSAMSAYSAVYDVRGGGQGEDMRAYFAFLCAEEGFVMLTGNSPDPFAGSSGGGIQAARPAYEAGYMIVVQADYDARGYTITMMRGQGEAPAAAPPESLLPETEFGTPVPGGETQPSGEPPYIDLLQSEPPASETPQPEEGPVSTNTINGMEFASYADGTVTINGDNVVVTPDGRAFVGGDELVNKGAIAVPEDGTRINLPAGRVVITDGDIYLIANGVVVYIEGGSEAYLYTEE